MSTPTIDRRLQSPPTLDSVTRAAAVGATVLMFVIGLAVAGSSTEPWWVQAALVAVLTVGMVAAVVDTVSHRIPDPLVLVSLGPVAVVIAIEIVAGDARTAVPAVLAGAALFAGPLLAAHLVAPAALGFGDVKLAVALGAALGMVEWRYTITALCLASGLTAAVAIVRRRPALPFAPGLVAGTALVVLLPTLEGSVPWP